MTHFQLVASVHVRHGRIEPGAAFPPHQLEARPNVLAAPTTPDPQYALAGRLDDHRGVAVPLLDGELPNFHETGFAVKVIWNLRELRP